MTIAESFTRLNPAQREAATHGEPVAGGGVRAGPLLVVAGAGTGKTSTLAHRVAHLLISGVAPERLLLLTFSRRAALEMTRRAQRVVADAMAAARPGAGASTSLRLPWSGTFHATGNRLIRQYAHRLGLDPTFSVLDRADAADLIDVVRHRLGLSKTERRFPRKDTCLGIYSHRVNTQQPLRHTLETAYPWCLPWEDELTALCRAYVEEKLSQQSLDYDDLLLYWQVMMRDPSLAGEIGGAVRSRAGGRVPGHERAAVRNPAQAEARRRRRDGRRRRRAGDLLVPRCDGRQYPRIPRAILAAGARGRARGELPLDAAGARRGQRRDRGRRAPVPEIPAQHARWRPATALRDGAGRPGAGRVRRRAGARVS